MVLEFLSAADNQLAGDATVVDRLSVEFDVEIVPGSILPRRHVLAEIGEPQREGLGILVRAAQIRANSVLFLHMGGAESRESSQFRVHLGFLDHGRIAGRDGFDFGVCERRRVEISQTSDRHIAAKLFQRFRGEELPAIAPWMADWCQKAGGKQV